MYADGKLVEQNKLILEAINFPRVQGWKNCLWRDPQAEILSITLINIFIAWYYTEIIGHKTHLSGCQKK